MRRTRVGPYDLGQARTLEQLDDDFGVLGIAQAARLAFPARELTDDEARRLAHGIRLPAIGLGTAPVAAFAPRISGVPQTSWLNGSTSIACSCRIAWGIEACPHRAASR